MVEDQSREEGLVSYTVGQIAKLASVNAHYLRETAPALLASLTAPRLEHPLARCLDPAEHAGRRGLI